MPLPAGSEVIIGGITVKVRSDGATSGIDMSTGPWREVIYFLEGDGNTKDSLCDKLMGLGVSPFKPFPHQYPGNTAIVCVSVRAEAAGAIGPDVTKIVTSDAWFIHTRYAALPFDIAGTDADLSFDGVGRPWCRDEIRGYTQGVTIGRGLKEVAAGPSAGEPIDSPAQKEMPHLEFRRTYLHVNNLGLANVLPLVGKLNDNTFWGQPRGQFYMEPWDVAIENGPDGTREGQLVLTLKWRPVNWNFEVNPAGTDFVQTTFDNYEYADFSPINDL